MKANELMIGDVVALSIDLLKETCPPFVSRLKIENIKAIDNGQLVAYPIPLTEDILKKNGFVTDNDHTLTGSCIYHRLCGKYEEYKVTVRLHNGWVKIESLDDKWYTLLDLSIQPRHVHELQHILRICGLIDLADNFNIE